MGTVFRAAMMVIFLGLCGLILWRWKINGWGSIVWIASAILMTVIRAPHAAKTRDNKITEKFAVNTERLLLVLVGIAGTYLPVIHLATGLLSFADYSAPNWVPAIGIALMVPGIWLFRRSHADLGRNWSVTTELREEHTLTTNGVYKRIRHPMYSAIWLIFASYPFLIQNWILGPAAIVVFAIMYVVRVPVEESMMRKQFGEAYDTYIAQTGRLWPRMSQ
ncbi:MAG: protein-S-isoprenylcysteine O-methyltransferase [Pseudomonadota bacterium]